MSKHVYLKRKSFSGWFSFKQFFSNVFHIMALQMLQSYESEYELERKQRIKENNEKMKQIFGETLTTLPEHFPAKKRGTGTPRAKSNSPFAGRRNEIYTPLRRNPKRSARSYHSEDVQSSEEASDDDIMSESRLMVYWVGPLTKKRRISGKCYIWPCLKQTSHELHGKY